MQAKALILAAGMGTRMKSEKPKVAHEMLGKPLINWVIDAATAAGAQEVVCVLGHKHELVEPLVEGKAKVAIQHNMLGTADAVNSAREALTDPDGQIFDGSLMVLCGDSPLVTPETIQAMVQMREQEDAAVIALTMEMANPFGYGRIVRGEDGRSLAHIVEQKDCTPEQAAITECNAGMYCFDARTLFWALERVTNDNAQGEYYITDVPKICNAAGKKVLAMKVGDPQECLGINSRQQLAEATKAMQLRINRAHMAGGVTMLDPNLVWIGPDVKIGNDVEILPMTQLWGATTVASGCVIGPNTRLTDTVVGPGCVVDETVAIEATLDDGVKCGPRAYLRPGTHMCSGSKAGTHVEIKNSTIGAGSAVPHLSYIGDTTMGSKVNIGAGGITCNYDGVNKNKTVIGDNVFVGSDTMMVAPVTIGDGAIIGAASCITRDVPADALALERSEQRIKENWASRHMEKLRAEKAARQQ